MLKLKKIFSIALAFAMIFSMSVSAFASDSARNQMTTLSYGYTYWKTEKKATGKTENGPQTIIIRAQGGRKFDGTIHVTLIEIIKANMNVGLLEAMKASSGVIFGLNSERTKSISAVFGGPNNNPNKRYEVRSWAVYDIYEVKGKEYHRIDGYEVPTGKSFGYSGDKKKSYTVKKYSEIAYGDDFVIEN